MRGELETEQTATYWPAVPLTIAALLFSFCWAAQPGVLRAQALCWELILTASNCNSNFNSNWLQLTRPSVALGYIIAWRPPASCGRRICTEFNPFTGQGDIFDRMHLFLDWWLGQRPICYICISKSQGILSLIFLGRLEFVYISFVSTVKF